MIDTKHRDLDDIVQELIEAAVAVGHLEATGSAACVTRGIAKLHALREELTACHWDACDVGPYRPSPLADDLGHYRTLITNGCRMARRTEEAATC